MAPPSIGQEIRKNRPFDLPQQEAFLNLVRTSSYLLWEFDALFKSAGLTHPTYNVLRILRGAAEPLPMLEVGSRLITKVPDITRLVDRLEKRSLVRRRRCDKDRRIVFVEATPAGLKKLADLDAPVTALHRRQFRKLTDDELTRLILLLEKARDGCAPPAEG